MAEVSLQEDFAQFKQILGGPKLIQECRPKTQASFLSIFFQYLH